MKRKKLTDKQIQEIKKLYGYFFDSDVGYLYGISKHKVWRIVNKEKGLCNKCKVEIEKNQKELIKILVTNK